MTHIHTLYTLLLGHKSYKLEKYFSHVLNVVGQVIQLCMLLKDSYSMVAEGQCF